MLQYSDDSYRVHINWRRVAIVDVDAVTVNDAVLVESLNQRADTDHHLPGVLNN